MKYLLLLPLLAGLVSCESFKEGLRDEALVEELLRAKEEGLRLKAELEEAYKEVQALREKIEAGEPVDQATVIKMFERYDALRKRKESVEDTISALIKKVKEQRERSGGGLWESLGYLLGGAATVLLGLKGKSAIKFTASGIKKLVS